MGGVETYDGLVSLIQDLELMLCYHNRIFGSDWPCSCVKQDIQIVYDEVSSMFSLLIDSDYDMMENDIISAVHDAQDFVDSCLNRCSSYRRGLTIDDLSLLHSIIKYIHSIHKSPQLTWPLPDTGDFFAGRSLQTGNQGRVDFMDRTEVNLDRFPFGEPGLYIFAVTGTEKRGKATAFIRRIYDHLLASFDFDIHALIAIERGDEFRHVLIRLLSCINSFGYNINYNSSAGNNELATRLYYFLMGRSYLIVLDDLYDSTIWDYLKRYFPDHNNGCGIVILTSATPTTPHAPRHYSSMSSNVETLTRNVRDGSSSSVDLRFLHLEKKLHDQMFRYRGVRNMLTLFMEHFTPADCSFKLVNLTSRISGQVVGHEKDICLIRDFLTEGPSKLKVFAVTGTGGIGKSTFTKTLYDDQSVYYFFDIRAWFTMSQHDQVRKVLIGLLGDFTTARSNEELRKQLYERLKGQRYLIVLDDMCDKNAWDDWKRAFPDDENGSRIMLTSRLRDVGIHASPDTPPHCLSLLNLDESWKLLCSKIFVMVSCPSELVNIGNSIAILCWGLPLAISLIGLYLSQMEKTTEIWNEVVLLLARGVILDDAIQELGCRLGSNIETQTNIMDSAVGTINSRCLRIQEKIDSINKELKKIRNDKEVLQKAPQSLVGATSAGYPFSTPEEDKLVGHENDLSTMLGHLTRDPPKRKVFAVTGMGGIGKTTLTKRLYDGRLVKESFDCRAWFTISQQYRVREVLIGLLRCLTDVVTEINEQSNEKLREELYKSLKGKRYLIVLDDLWDNNAWDDLKRIFPDDENGSRILLTSRLVDVAIHASPDTPLHCLSFLSEDESWELLRSKIFAKESCRLELEVIGKQIAGKCHGLPLAIVVVGGLLSKMNKTLEVWQQFARSVSSRVMEKAEHCKNILAYSYNHLPHHLKVCFLYMGIFPEDYEIPVQTVIWLWIAEGFIRPTKVKSLEELAEEYLEELISRNLIMVKRRKPAGRSKICYIHDLLRDLCLTESQNQNFFHAFRSVTRQDFRWEMQRRLCFHSNTPDHVITSSFPYIRSFLWFKTLTLSSDEKFLSMNFKFLKVMNIRNLHLKELPRKILGLAHLRYLSITFQDSIDRSIFSSKLHNLQILIIESDWNGRLPEEFWDMSEIRHLQFKRCFLSYWPNESTRPNILQLSSASERQPFICQLKIAEHPLKVLHNLQSLTTIRPISCTKNVFLSMPNLKKLGIYENKEDNLFRGWFKNLTNLQELQTLKYILGDRYIMKPDPLPSPEFFPPKLTKLTLRATSLPWEDMIKLSKLPNLEVLKLQNYAFSGAIWKSEDGGFPCLKCLLIGKTNLQIWEADGSHFPKLQHLVMMDCRSLKEIPCSIGEALLLEKIELHNCSESAATSAQKIQSEQQDWGNYDLTVNISKW